MDRVTLGEELGEQVVTRDTACNGKNGRGDRNNAPEMAANVWVKIGEQISLLLPVHLETREEQHMLSPLKSLCDY